MGWPGWTLPSLAPHGNDRSEIASVVRASRLLKPFLVDDLLGLRFALNVFLASIVVWLVMGLFTHASPIWAIASMIASSEPIVKQGLKMFRSRLINTLVGCAVGLVFVAVGEPEPWKIPFALAITVLLASYVVRIPVMWRQAPITAAIVIAGSLSHHTKIVGAELGTRRVAEVIFGSVVGLLVSVMMGWLWPLKDPARRLPSPPR